MTKFSQTAEQYMRQLAAVCGDQRRFEQELRNRGWIYNPVLQTWRHPDRPGEEVML